MRSRAISATRRLHGSGMQTVRTLCGFFSSSFTTPSLTSWREIEMRATIMPPSSVSSTSSGRTALASPTRHEPKPHRMAGISTGVPLRAVHALCTVSSFHMAFSRVSPPFGIL